ncbi:YggS family pyridoxal phosphate-dependent enzyme [Ancylomarina euxinus]|uniref:Pyridoxal phosphate homeostasis protein n=1 Tax=Ancylomarina euxinus TaxID=2283627 RepID=A0A425Y094_9BACT|nr:YggS family pyridoxal phosphate-dependent enzyme [Ancylomarina euxinus]MCZ4695376.1 YggS family pyridoxal phosphate-dependent enzyme [Ancylomarina euxinus]MUP15572.1 YggS family pyridoxal phosphate-dependent enzyme [Ancylomarina euxinus]RRG20984.1 YggS family pyridoxal phosphate-dependent enzyme [Ancylomarina euxinus]
MSISQNIDKILKSIPENVKLIAVSKTKPQEDIIEAYEGGYKIFGENKPQELKQKYEALPKDIEWHFIGHLQTNKVKYIAGFVQLIHAVDSMKLLQEINKQALKHNRVINCLLQFHIAQEESKFGYDLAEAKGMLNSEEFENLEGINIIGVMGMATFTDDQDQVRAEFKQLKTSYEALKSEFFNDKDDFSEISMGMSGDYQLAIEEGSTMVRVGSSIFGSR